MAKKTFDPEMLMTRYLDLRDTASEAPKYWDSVQSFNQFTEGFVIVSGRSVSFDENFSDAELDKLLSGIENSFAKDLKHLRKTAANQTYVGLAKNSCIAKD